MEGVQIVVDIVSLAEALWAIGGAVGGLVAGVLGTLMFGRRYKERMAALEAKASAPVVNVNIGEAVERALGNHSPRPGTTRRVAEYLPDRMTLRVGTKVGDAEIRLEDGKQAVEDILQLLGRLNATAPLRPKL